MKKSETSMRIANQNNTIAAGWGAARRLLRILSQTAVQVFTAAPIFFLMI
jgi:hypothetical protein